MPRTPIRIKLALTLAVPLAALLARTAVDIRAESQEVDGLRSQAELARAAVGPGGLINHLQNERTWAVVDLAGADDLGINAPVESYEEARRFTDEAVAALAAELETRDDDVGGGYIAALAGLGALGALREDIDRNRATSEVVGTTGNTEFTEQVYQRYVDLIVPFFEATDDIVQSIADPELRRGAELVNLASRDIQQYSDMSRHMLIDGMSANGVDGRDEIRSAAATRALWDRYNARLVDAEPPYDAVVTDHFPFEFVADFTELSDRSLRGEQIPLNELVAPMVPVDWGGLGGFREALSDQVNAAADRVAADAQRREQAFLLTAVAILAFAVVLCWLVSRSITVPLRSLSRQAASMARDRLPVAVATVLDTPLGEDVRVAEAEPVRVRTSDEVAEVADAINIVQETALDLALEQAVLRRNIADSFVNLGRRNQNLLMRLLDVITQLERVETDPDSLADLYRLDHLATRMRRNAESLLVLAGLAPPRQWSTPVNLTDVVRSALGEVEDFQRVEVAGVEPATVLGSTASDLAHLLAELIENALTYSPSDAAVTIRGRHLDDGTYGLAVFDAGLGMDAESLAAANRRLAGAESFTVAPSKYLGHYVAGNLAARHGIRVQLAPAHTGTTATVVLPSQMLASGAPVLTR